MSPTMAFAYLVVIVAAFECIIESPCFEEWDDGAKTRYILFNPKPTGAPKDFDWILYLQIEGILNSCSIFTMRASGSGFDCTSLRA